MNVNGCKSINILHTLGQMLIFFVKRSTIDMLREELKWNYTKCTLKREKTEWKKKKTQQMQ